MFPDLYKMKHALIPFPLQVDMSVLFPDLYKRKHALTADMMAGRLVPPTDTIANKRQIYVASQAVGLYSMHFLQATTEVALGFGNGKINVHNYKTTKRSYTAQVGYKGISTGYMQSVFYSNGFTSISNSCTANGRNRRIQIINIKPVTVKEV